jgi:hypothetical protein
MATSTVSLSLRMDHSVPPEERSEIKHGPACAVESGREWREGVVCVGER